MRLSDATAMSSGARDAIVERAVELRWAMIFFTIA